MPTRPKQPDARPAPRPPSLAEEAFLDLCRTAEALAYGLAEALKPFGVTPTQYEVLRILREAGREGLPCSELGGRLVSRDPDVTRLLDRLERMGLVQRGRDALDRRVVTARLTTRGHTVAAELAGLVEQLHFRQLDHLGESGLRALIRLLESARERVA